MLSSNNSDVASTSSEQVAHVGVEILGHTEGGGTTCPHQQAQGPKHDQRQAGLGDKVCHPQHVGHNTACKVLTQQSSVPCTINSSLCWDTAQGGVGTPQGCHVKSTRQMPLAITGFASPVAPHNTISTSLEKTVSWPRPSSTKTWLLAHVLTIVLAHTASHISRILHGARHNTEHTLCRCCCTRACCSPNCDSQGCDSAIKLTQQQVGLLSRDKG